MATERQIAANRANAQRSTGPRTPEGKERSAMNSLKHGCYSERSIAIPRGALAEDPEQVKAFVDELIDDLEPRDLLERVAAREIAYLMLKTLRVSGFEAEALAGASTQRLGHAPAQDTLTREEYWEYLTERGAAHAIDDVLQTTERISGTISLRLTRALDRYEKLQARDLEGDFDLFDDPGDDVR